MLARPGFGQLLRRVVFLKFRVSALHISESILPTHTA